MGDLSTFGDGQAVESANENSANIELGNVATASSTTHTKGSWSELVASAARDASAINIMVNPNTGSGAYLIDIGIGGAGSEQILVSNLWYARIATYLNQCGHAFLPVHVPKGARLAVRTQSDVSSAGVGVAVNLHSGGLIFPKPLGRVTTYGANTGTTRATQIDPGGSASTKGSWTQITSSTTNPMKGLLVAAAQVSGGNGGSSWWALDVGIGGAGSEQIILPNLLFAQSTTGSSVFSNVTPSFSPCFPVSIPAGTRIAARAADLTTDATARLIQIAIYGID